MDLYEKQKKLQRSSYVLLQEKIQELKNDAKAGKYSQDFAKAGAIVGYMQKLIKVIDNFKEEYSLQIIGKFIKENESYFSKNLPHDYKNIEDFLAQPITKSILNSSAIDDAFEEFKQSKEKFRELDSKVLKDSFKNLLKYTKKRMDIDGDFYLSLAESKSEQFFKEMPQRVAFALLSIDSKEIAYMLMTPLLSLQTLDNADSENTANGRQSFGAAIGETFHERIAWRFLSTLVKKDNKEEKIKEVRKLFNLYDADSFKNIDELSKPLWNRLIELEVGQKLLDLAIEVGIVVSYTKPHDESNFNYLKIDSEFLKTMNNTDKSIAYSASMMYKPMVIEPIDWTELYDGGFIRDDLEKDSRFNLSLIKASSRKDRKALIGKKIPKKVLEAVNHLQKSAFSINENMLKVLRYYHDNINYKNKNNKIDFAYYRILREILSHDIYEKSKKEIYKYFKKAKFIKVRDEELNKKDKQRIDNAIKEIAKSSDIVHLKLVSNIQYDIAKYKGGIGTIVANEKDDKEKISLAEELKKFEQFYFVWLMDFRGRLYPQQTLLNPQAGDLPKSLLLFSKEKELTQEGLRWFFIHGANTYGEVDKETFDIRVAWIKEHSSEILASAQNYKKEDFWKKAGDPFKFLAFCFEYARYIEEPTGFKTALPIAIDGSNNGFQHIVALLKDKEGAEMVNVLPHYVDSKLKVADFYASVAMKLKSLMEEEYQEFEKNKEKYLEKDGLFYKEVEEKQFEPAYHFTKLVEFLKTVDVKEIKNNKYFSTHIIENASKIKWGVKLSSSELEIVENVLKKLEKKVRNEIGKDDLEELKEELIYRLEGLQQRIERGLSKDKYFTEKERVYSLNKIQKLVEVSFYGKLFDAGLIKRKFVKGPVMTESYGSSTVGKAKAILEDLEGSGLLIMLNSDERYDVASAITKLLEKSLSLVSKSPSKYKKWMQNYAKTIAKKEGIFWKTPYGLEVEQVEYKSESIKISVAGTSSNKVVFKIYTDELDEKAHKQGLSPNYIHSLDATHLMMTINELKKERITDIITVHDSFATHANDVGTMSKVLRKTFVELHSSPLLEELTEFFEERFNVEQKKIPYVDKEGFDLNEVLKSEYFFA
jgi:DNA-directed RNA polymerase